MKKMIYALAIAVLAIMSCKKVTPVDYSVITGRVQNMENKDIKIMMGREVVDSLAVAKDGSFRDTLRLIAGTYSLMDGKQLFNFYVENGNNLQINYDVKDFYNTLDLSESTSDVNSYYAAKVKKEKEMIGEFSHYYSMDERTFLTKGKENKAALEKLLSSYENIPETFIKKEKRNLQYEYLSKLPDYEPAHRHFSKQPDFKVSEGFLDELDGFDYNNEEDFLSSSSYQAMVINHYNRQAYALARSEGIGPGIALLKISKNIPNENIRNKILFSSAEAAITRSADLDMYYEEFMNISTNEDHKASITGIYKKLKVLDKGQPSPKFVNYENYNGGTTSLDHLKGKYVYIDVWATWCGPCKREIPFLKKVEQKYHDKNIEFVSISVDKAKDHEAWKKMVKEKELGGIQLFADKSFESSFVQEYSIKGIPKFILIDPQGNIVTANAPRPSDDKLVALFDRLDI